MILQAGYNFTMSGNFGVDYRILNVCDFLIFDHLKFKKELSSYSDYHHCSAIQFA